jgi:uncharacterized protein GlcG (DUF336 family)
MKIALLIALVAVLAGPAMAQVQAPTPGPAQTLAERIAAMPKGLPRAKAPDLDLSIQAARAAVAACAANGHQVSALITDSVGDPVVLLSGDGAGLRSELVVRTKANTVVKYRMSSLEVANRAEKDAKLKAEIEADPDIGMARGGGVPIVVNGEFLGAFAVSGAFGPDEECVTAALAKVQLH